jgi:hypothetical protein
MKNKLIQNTLEGLLNVRFRIGDTEDVIEESLMEEEKKLFCDVIESMERLHTNEVTIYRDYGISLSTLADSYWEVIENLIDFMYLPEAADAIMWYIQDRKDSSGKIYKWTDEEDGKSYKFETPEDLFEYIRYKYEGKQY